MEQIKVSPNRYAHLLETLNSSEMEAFREEERVCQFELTECGIPHGTVSDYEIYGNDVGNNYHIYVDKPNSTAIVPLIFQHSQAARDFLTQIFGEY